MTDSLELLITGSIFALGFLGFFAVTLLPLRAVVALRRNRHLWQTTIGKVALGAVATLAVVAVSLSVPFVARVVRCLTETYCGPGIASGWFYLAFVGVFYLGFEALSYVALRVGSRASRVAT